MTTALQCSSALKPDTLAGFEPGISCSVGGRDDRYVTPPRKFSQDVGAHFWQPASSRFFSAADFFCFFLTRNKKRKKKKTISHDNSCT
jgi:hypothetical protein